MSSALKNDILQASALNYGLQLQTNWNETHLTSTDSALIFFRFTYALLSYKSTAMFIVKLPISK